MPKPNRMTEPVIITKADLIKIGAINPELKKYADAVMSLLDSSMDSAAGHMEIRNENGLPVLRFTPRRVPLADLIKNKL